MDSASKMRRVAVFCGSKAGRDAGYAATAAALGKALAERELELVYGGGNVGLMGVVADAVLAHGGRVIGVIPQALVNREVAHRHLSELRVVHTMHERKAMMLDLADAFVALPGGVGTLEEIIEVVSWAQLGIHGKPCALLDVADYYGSLWAFVERMVEQDFAPPTLLRLLTRHTAVSSLLDELEGFDPPVVPAWLTSDET